ncbi:MAG: non-canonical purine NTP pyrophosphatase [Candidatus Melainabacteria bacterium]
MPIITLATGNAHKVRELQAILKTEGFHDTVSLVLCPALLDVAETGTNFLENARLKATANLPATGSHLILAEDSGLEIPALAGRYGLNPFPGLCSNRWLDASRCREILDEAPAGSGGHVSDPDQKNRAILTLMRDMNERRAAYVCGMVVWDTAQQQVIAEAEERMPLTVISGTPRGVNGFGYDSITVPLERNPQGLTTAELPPAIKDAMSHRAGAFRAVIRRLMSQTADTGNP